MKKPAYFQFSHYTTDWAGGELSFSYVVGFEDGGTQSFTEMVALPEPVDAQRAEHQAVKAALELVHLTLGVSYFIRYGPAEIRHSYMHTQAQADYWNLLYTKGLGEFYYTNDIDFRGAIAFPAHASQPTPLHEKAVLQERALVLHGGGKDSIVSAEAIMQGNIPFDLFAINEKDIQKAVAEVMGKKTKTVNRLIDQQIIALKERGEVLDGHVPVTAINASVAILYAALYDYRFVVVSNERSSAYGNVEYCGITVNHQWSKSPEFEDALRAYIDRAIPAGIEYFSLLRPIYELRIAQLFSSYPQYFEVFSSSNHNFTIHPSGKKLRWDMQFSKGKVEFVWALLSAFLPKGDMFRIFQDDLYADASLLDKFKQLLGTKDIKPLECVGTPDEMRAAMYLCLQRGEFNDTPIMKYFSDEVLPAIQNPEVIVQEVLSYGDDYGIPDRFKQALFAIMSQHEA